MMEVRVLCESHNKTSYNKYIKSKGGKELQTWTYK